MTDIHSHILFGVDDGAADADSSLKMAQLAVDSGTTRMVATPHCAVPGMFDNFYGSELKARFDSLKELIHSHGIPLEIVPGMEVFVSDRTDSLISQRLAVTINFGRYMLVEFDFSEDPRWATERLWSISRLGIVPVIAHPERYHFAQRQPRILYDWVRSGSLLQLNKGSLFGLFGLDAQMLANSLMEHNLVHLIASDAHGYAQRTPDMSGLYDLVSTVFSADTAERLLRINPDAIIDDKPVMADKPEPFI